MTAPRLADYAAYAEARACVQPPLPDDPLVSIVTVTLQAAAAVERTIRSVQAQSCPSIEQIFVDGGSSDATIDIVRRLARPGDYWISEADRGISDAFNKGIALARGRFIQILNADDWLSGNQIETAIRAIEQAQADFAFGDVIFYEGDRPIFTYAGDPHYAGTIERRMPVISHPTVLATRDCFEQIGLFDLSYRNAMDYDWFLRLHRAGKRGVYSNAIVGHMTHAGVSNRQFKRTIDEVKTIAIAHGRNPWAASAEARLRCLKTAASQPVRRHLRPVYELVRRVINRSYRPAPADL